jgi:hypothetical protein
LRDRNLEELGGATHQSEFSERVFILELLAAEEVLRGGGVKEMLRICLLNELKEDLSVIGQARAGFELVKGFESDV